MNWAPFSLWGWARETWTHMDHLPDVEESSHFTDEVTGVLRASQKQSLRIRDRK